MKKSVWLWIVSPVILLLGSVSFAEEMKGMESKDSMMKKGMMDKGMMGRMTMKMMMEKSVVATSDGGVVIVTSNKITKYDKDLNIVKEAEIKIDEDAMKKQMADMMKMCPMMGNMKDMGEESERTEVTSIETKADATDHSAHH